VSGTATGWRARVTARTVELFSHAPDPLAATFDHPGDPGLFGPGSVTWRIMGDVSTFVGGIRALLVQAAHPEVAAGVGDHSSYREDSLGRLSRTASYVTATAFGSMPEVDGAIAHVRRAHRPVSGTSHRGLTYSADTPEMAAWVHNALIDSFLAAHRAYGPSPLSDADADAYVAEQTRLGGRMGAAPLPDTADELAGWLSGHPALGPSPAGSDAIDFLARPRLPWSTRIAYRVILHAAVATIPPPIRRAIGVRRRPGARLAGRLVIGVLRRALGCSPAWAAALDRCDAPRPTVVRFRSVAGVTR